MNIAYTILLQIIKMFIMILTGYLLYKKKLVLNNQLSALSNILLYVATPAILTNSFLQVYNEEMIPKLLVSFLLSLLIYILCMLLGKILYKKDDAVDKFAIVFSNAGFFGIPLIGEVFGSTAIFYLAPFIGLFYIFIWTYGVYIMSKDNQISIKKILLNPSIFALFLGILIFLLRINLPNTIKGVITTFAGLNTPLAMLILGSYVARVNIKDIFINKKAYLISFYRLIMIPIIVLILFKFIPNDWNEVKYILLIAISAPVATLTSVFSQMYDNDYNYATQTICLSTLLCIITIPLIVILANVFW